MTDVTGREGDSPRGFSPLGHEWAAAMCPYPYLARGCVAPYPRLSGVRAHNPHRSAGRAAAAVAGDARGAGGMGSSRLTWLWEGLGEVDRVSVRIQDVGYALPPGHVVRRAEDPAAEDIDVFQQALHVPDAQVSDVHVE